MERERGLTHREAFYGLGLVVIQSIFTISHTSQDSHCKRVGKWKPSCSLCQVGKVFEVTVSQLYAWADRGLWTPLGSILLGMAFTVLLDNHLHFQASHSDLTDFSL